MEHEEAKRLWSGLKDFNLRYVTFLGDGNYGLAIRRSVCTSMSTMRNSIWAVFMHQISTDQDPHHFFCPKEYTSWCFYNKALAKGDTPVPHSSKSSLYLAKLSEGEQEYVRQVFRDHSSFELPEMPERVDTKPK